MRISDNAFYTAFNVTISFKARTRDGLLLYSYGSNADFISLSLSRGKVRFEVDFQCFLCRCSLIAPQFNASFLRYRIQQCRIKHSGALPFHGLAHVSKKRASFNDVLN